MLKELMPALTRYADGGDIVAQEAKKEIEKLRAALEPFAKARTPEGYFGTTPTHADFMAARTALGMQAGPVPTTPST